MVIPLQTLLRGYLPTFVLALCWRLFMSLNPLVAAVGGLVVVLSLWVADHSVQVKKQAQQESASLADELEVQRAHVAGLAIALRDQSAIRTVLSEMNTRLNQAQSTLAGQTAHINRSLAELKRSDEQITAYLASPVPGALGLRYARTETTDPVEYRAGAAGVRADLVPAAGSAGSDR